MPKVIMLEKDIEKKIKNKTIHIAIAYEQSNYKDMKYLIQEILREHPDGISGYNIRISLIKYSEFKESDSNTNMLYMFPSSKDNLEKLTKAYYSSKAITFASNKEYLKYNAMISIDVGKKVKPIVNLVAIKNSGIKFKPVLLSISKVFKDDE